MNYIILIILLITPFYNQSFVFYHDDIIKKINNFKLNNNTKIVPIVKRSKFYYQDLIIKLNNSNLTNQHFERIWSTIF